MICSAGTCDVVVECGRITVTVKYSVNVEVGSGSTVMVMKVVGWVEVVVVDGVASGIGTSTVVAAIVTAPPEVDVVEVATVVEAVVVVEVVVVVGTAEVVEAIDVVEDAATRPSTLDAVALSVHSTTTPVVEFIGIAKHSVPAVHLLMRKLPAWLQLAILPERQAMCPGVHGDRKLSF